MAGCLKLGLIMIRHSLVGHRGSLAQLHLQFSDHLVYLRWRLIIFACKLDARMT